MRDPENWFAPVIIGVCIIALIGWKTALAMVLGLLVCALLMVGLMLLAEKFGGL